MRLTFILSDETLNDTVVPTNFDDYSADSTTQGIVYIDQGPVDGEIEVGGDRDWFAVELVAGERYEITLKGLDEGLGLLENPMLILRSADGEEIASNDDYGFDTLSSKIFYTPAETGTYIVDAGAYDSDELSVGTYQLEAKSSESEPLGAPEVQVVGGDYTIDDADFAVIEASDVVFSGSTAPGADIEFTLTVDGEAYTAWTMGDFETGPWDLTTGAFSEYSLDIPSNGTYIS